MTTTRVSLLRAPLLAMALLAPAVGLAQSDKDLHRENTLLMGTIVEFVTDDADDAKVRLAFDAGFAEVKRLDRMLSEWSKSSEIASVNASGATEEVYVSQETFDLLSKSTQLCRETKGAFDITWATMRYLWDFNAKYPVVPTAEEIDARRRKMGCDKIALKSNLAVRLLVPGTQVGLGGIAKGYAMERAAQKLVEAGLTTFIVKAGGDMVVRGKRGGTQLWNVGIQHPRKARGETMGQVYVWNHGVSTSGDYERFFFRGEGRARKRYHHIIDPRTGRPATGVISVTVVSTDPTLADAWTKVLFVLGPKAGIALIDKRTDVHGLVVDASGKVTLSKGMKEYVRVPPKIDAGGRGPNE